MKSSYILVDVQSYIVSVALMSGGELKEYYVEYAGSTGVTGNIYKGKVVNILSGLQSRSSISARERTAFCRLTKYSRTAR